MEYWSIGERPFSIVDCRFQEHQPAIHQPGVFTSRLPDGSPSLAQGRRRNSAEVRGAGPHGAHARCGTAVHSWWVLAWTPPVSADGPDDVASSMSMASRVRSAMLAFPDGGIVSSAFSYAVMASVVLPQSS